jgi:hydrogenase maturation protease
MNHLTRNTLGAPRLSHPCQVHEHPTRTLIVGLGSPHGDDQLGWRVAERLALDLAASEIDVRTVRSAGELLDWVDGVERLIVCDACQSQGLPGAVRCCVWPAAELSTVRSSGSHDLELASALALADELGRLPGEVMLIAVEERQHVAGSDMSPEVAAAVPRVVELILRELNDARSLAGQNTD